MEKSKTREEDIASPKRAAPVRARTLRRIDRDDRVEASADIRTDNLSSLRRSAVHEAEGPLVIVSNVALTATAPVRPAPSAQRTTNPA